MKYITEEGLKQLNNYKYKPGGYTWLDLKMNYFWQWTVSLVPTWVAPNLLTFIGWLFVIASYANMLRYDLTLKKDLPPSAFFFAAACIFIYSTLDAIDGKQARRTKTSSPLGQLFDHGCDSFSIGFFMLAICQAVKLQTPEVFFIFVVCQASFWSSNWVQYNTGILRTKVGQFGVTQGEFSCMFIHILTGIFGQHMWAYKLGELLPIPSDIIHLNSYTEQIFNLPLSFIVVYYYGGMLLLMIIYTALRTLIESQHRVKAAMQCFSPILLILMELSYSKMQIYQEYSGLILVNFSIVGSLLACKIIICSVTEMKYQYFHSQLIPLMISTMVLAILDLNGGYYQLSIYILLASILANLIIILMFLASTINQITEFLGIYCFSISKKRKPKHQ